ncbi:MAG: sorbitol-6-phosphate dehydrogenase [Fimbriimonadales bacterium]
MRLAGQVAWITGSAQGLGEALAFRFAEEGCRGLLLTDIQQEAIARVAQSVQAQHPTCQVLGLVCDVRDETQVAQVVGEAFQRFGALDILVANAGVIHSAELTEMSLSDWQWQMDVNLTGYFLCAREAARVMKAQGRGVILQINSKSGLKGSYKNCAYAASKFGGIGLTQSIAMDLAPYGIRVNAICPGNLLDSPMWQGTLFEQYARKWGLSEEAIRKYYEAQVPLGRGCTYKDVADLAVFLASDEASYITGEAYRVAGGQL